MKSYTTTLTVASLASLLASLTHQSESTIFSPEDAKKSLDEKCRIIAMSGGSNHGAWEAGVLWGLVNYGNPEDFAWNVVSGVSAGSLNTVMTAYFDVGDEVNMTQFMSDKWASATTHEIWTFRRDPGPIRSLWEAQSVLDDQPGYEFIQGAIEEMGDIKRSFIFGAVDVNTGEY